MDHEAHEGHEGGIWIATSYNFVLFAFFVVQSIPVGEIWILVWGRGW